MEEWLVIAVEMISKADFMKMLSRSLLVTTLTKQNTPKSS